MQRINKYIAVLTLILFNKPILAERVNESGLRILGDYLQVVNPVVALGVSSKARGMGHFTFIYGQNMLYTHGTKFIANKTKWSPSRRPRQPHKQKERYDGMPSGHTSSAWVAAAYIRQFGDEYYLYSLPLYANAILVGWSRIDSKEHTPLQVIAAAALSELTVLVNNHLQWSQNYQTISVNVAPTFAKISWQINL